MRYLLLLLFTGCAFTNSNIWTGETAWTIGDASIGCDYDESGYPSGGENCISSGSEAVEAIAESQAAIAVAENEDNNEENE